MRKFLAILSSLLLFVFQLSAQNIQGTVVDEFTGKGIAFVSLGIIGTNLATITNENGEFVIKVESYPAKVRFSHVSYLLGETDLIQPNQSKLIIKLKPAITNLNEVIINANKAENLLKAALKKAKDNSSKQIYSNAFYRQLTSINDKPSKVYEMFYDLKWNTKAAKGWIVKQTRFAEDTEQSEFAIANQSFLTLIFSGVLLPEDEGKFINLQTLKEYEITIEKYIEQPNQDIAVITCKFKSPRRKLFYVNSTYYVGTKDFKIYRLENDIFNIPMDFPITIVKIPPFLKTVATFNGDGKEYPVLESISTKLTLSINYGKSLANINVNSLLTVFNVDENLKKQNYKSLDSKTQDQKTVQSVKYDVTFWKNNPIVKQTTLEDSFIKMMESKSAFGTMTNP
ncbi:carboxypeptidase-like regulatory domain-containing protein [Pedobacter frigiditerrae]|uniref:carboxypeptidase-like regulatory domain-containing protein n=1 Tax=Pedobacter frigiditerrae TaxID=2530452 RepID=UPI00292F35A4|nr:carboxypeptidase-like regulatory domain-containing protein [Pedobacter frigiditerrae]